MAKYIPVIGLEIHVELKTRTKMFCFCKNDPEEKQPNLNICPVCLGHPGTLPVVNQEAVRKTIKTGLALNCEIEKNSFFERKNYFYPDLPKGYQISQYQKPLCKNGYLEIDGRKIRIRRIHLEEDTGRLIHKENFSLVDFNRAGIPLMEMVTEPDIRSPKEARKFAEELQLILRYLNVSNADMEKGEMRVEANISLTEKENFLGTKIEIKNLNSFRSVEKAIDYEIERQAEILNNKKTLIQETRGWSDVEQKTFSQREKEEAHDYRYFPEPDLPPLIISDEIISEVRKQIPELPFQKRQRFKKEYELDEKTVEIFIKNKDLSEYFEKIISELAPNLAEERLKKLIKLSTNYLLSDLIGFLGSNPFIEDKILITPANFARFVTLIDEGKISSKIAKIILKEMFETGNTPDHIIAEKGLLQLTDENEIERIIKEIISKNEKAVEDFKKGKTNVLQFLIGEVMKISKGKVNPQIAKEKLEYLLTEIKKKNKIED